MTVTGYGQALGAGTILNAISTWKGAAFGLDLKTFAKVELSQGDGPIEGIIEENGDMDTTLIENAVGITLDLFNLKMQGTVQTRSEIPHASGLKSSSAAANAVIIATLDAIKESMEPLEMVKLGVQAAKKSGVTITGAFDDACASFFGGVVVTDNKEDILFNRIKKNSEVLVFVPPQKAYSSETDVTGSKLIGPWIDMAYDLVIHREFEKAMTLNGFLYCGALGFDTKPMMVALESGIEGVTLSGTGPAYVAMGESSDLDKLAKAWEKRITGGNVIRTKINNEGAI